LDTLLHLKSVFQTFYLCQILFLPAEDQQIVSEDLLHWVNTCDPAPSREQGLELASMSEPYTSDLFWSYLPRCILRGLFKAAVTLMNSLQEHQVPFVRKGARLACHLLQTFPRSTSYGTLDDFNRACHLFRRSVKDTIRDLESEFDDDALWSTPSKRKSSKGYMKEDQRLEWFARILSILKLLSGEQDTVMETSEDWKEALAAWALLVRPTMTRDDVPCVFTACFWSTN
jgi:nuclear pore complex protein Nup85